MIAMLWLGDIMAHLTIPSHQSDVPGGKAPMITYSLDLAIVIPLMITAAIGLWRKTQFGIKLAGVMLVKTSLLSYALMAMSLSMYFQNLNPDFFLVILWCIIGLLGTFLTFIFLLRSQLSWKKA